MNIEIAVVDLLVVLDLLLLERELQILLNIEFYIAQIIEGKFGSYLLLKLANCVLIELVPNLSLAFAQAVSINQDTVIEEVADCLEGVCVLNVALVEWLVFLEIEVELF